MAYPADIKQPLDFVINDDLYQPSFLQEDPRDGYQKYIREKCRSQRDHINWLQTELKNTKTDLASAWTGCACLLVVLGIVLYQWLVVCHGQAPHGF